MKAPAHGFTIVEIVIVVTILGIVAAAVLPAISSSLEWARLSNAADWVASAVEFAQFSATSSGRPYRVTVDPANNSLLVERAVYGSGIPSDALAVADSIVEATAYQTAPNPLLPGNQYAVSFATDSQFVGVVVASSSFAAATPLVFDGLGTPSGGGTVTLARGSMRLLVRVAAGSGETTVGN
jgi:prepilin-type N-terminal cleavage/methylation domain-containing protein